MHTKGNVWALLGEPKDFAAGVANIPDKEFASKVLNLIEVLRKAVDELLATKAALQTTINELETFPLRDSQKAIVEAAKQHVEELIPMGD